MPQHREKQCYRCPLCPSLFEQLEQLVQHQKSMHPVQMTGSVQSSSLAHLSISAPAVSASKSLYQCTDCGEWFNSSSELQMHASSSDHRPFTCDLCNKRFQNRRSLNRHFRLHTNASFACDRCPKQFKTLPYLKSHQQTHDRQRSRSCTQCGASFSRSDQLHRHMLIHDTEKRFRCPFSESVGCQRQFQRSDKLKQHLATHMKTPASPQPTSSNSSLVCPHCGRSYVNRKTYFLHLRAHSLDQQRLRESFDNVRETKLLPKTIQAISELEGDSVVSDLQLEVTVGGDISTESAAEAEQNDSIPWWGCTACAKLFASASELYEHGCVPETCKSTSAPSGDTRNTLHLALNAINDSIDTDPPFVDLLPNQSQVPDIYSRHNATKSSLFDTASSIHNHS